MAGSGGPWGGGGNGNGEDRGGGRDNGGDDNRGGPPRRPNDPPGLSQIDDLVRSGQERLRVLMGGRGSNGGGNGRGPVGGGRGPDGPMLTKQGLGLAALAAVGLWGFMSFYSVRPEEKSVELFLGEFSQIGEPGLNFAPWPLVTKNIVPVGVEQTTEIGLGDQGNNGGLMLTRDQNIVDIGFQVVWNISDPQEYLFNLKEPDDTIRAVSESAMRDIIARSELSPILNRDRGLIVTDLRTAIQTTLDSYNAGISVIRVNLQRAAPPSEVAAAFSAVQSAQQQRQTLQNQADAYAAQATAGARGQAAALLEEAEAYRARVVNDARGEAAAFISVYEEYAKAPEVTRRRMYLETMERVFGGMNKVILDGVSSGDGGGQGVVPFLPLNELGRMAPGAGSTGAAATTGGTN
jgi:modulator of FtsH protease HflK